MTSPVVLGLGGCVDFEMTVSGALLADLVHEYGIRTEELTSWAPVNTERDLVISILDFIRRGGGGERFVASPEVLTGFAQRGQAQIALGGTSVRAGLAMSRLGVPSLLHLVSLNDHVRRLLPDSCDYICSSDYDTLYPHVIVQYDHLIEVKAGDIDIRAPFPNRLIYVNDPANEKLRLSDELGDALAQARLFLISGFNGARDRKVLNRRLTTLRHHMQRLPAEALVYYEDAGFHRPSFSQRVRAALLDRIDVYGLNEDELQAYLRRSVDLLSVNDVADALAALRALIPAPSLVLHTKYWALAYGEQASAYTDALDHGILVASTRYSYGDTYQDEQLDELRNRPRRVEAVSFAAELEQRLGLLVRCLPGLLLDVPTPTTIGLGDTFVGGFLTSIAQRATTWT